QIRAGTKTVTRRVGWKNLMPGTLLSPVKKGMGLKPGEKIERLRGPIRVIRVRREALCRMTDNIEYGYAECRCEGFPDFTPARFVEMFCSTHKGCTPETTVTRIEFEYLPDQP